MKQAHFWAICCISLISLYSQAEESDYKLETIEVTATTANSASNEDYINDSGLSVNVIDTSEFLNSAKDINQILNSTAGIIIRNSGGLGSQFKLALNGLSDKQIRYFMDGVPMENFGSALTLDNYLVNLIESVEVYKGVVPTYLSADALGGAINIVTPSYDKEFADISYTYGSFNTQRFSFNGQLSDSEKYYARISTFFNHSDNDYEMKNAQKVTDEFGNINGTTSAKRFHDEYSSRMMSLQGGIINQPWAEELSLKVTKADNKNNLQHPFNSIDAVLGKYHTRNNTGLASINHRVNIDKFKISTYYLRGEITELFNDTSSRNYRWDGTYEPIDSNLGELGEKSKLELTDKISRANIRTDYQISKNHALALSYSQNTVRRQGNDEINNTDNLFFKPKKLNKSVTAINYDHRPDSGFINTGLFYKHYSLTANAESFLAITGERSEANVDESDMGYGFTSKIKATESSDIRLSYERAYRLPEADEIIGFGPYVRPNPSLKPETSNNINLGINYNYLNDNINTVAEVNTFYRNAENFTRYKADQGSSGIYENVVDVSIKGVEISASAIINNFYTLQANATYQDMINESDYDQNGNKDLNKGSRIPNEPYLFANIKAGINFHTRNYNEISAFWTTNYVHEYYLHWENLGNKSDKAIIDTQLTHDLELRYAMSHGTYNVSFSATNISDQTVYDNYNIQKPGRSYYLKFRYSY
ncbi:MAG: TonB-dependent receptor [Oleispira sp.]